MKLKNLHKLPLAYRSLYRDVKRQQRFMSGALEPLLEQAGSTNDGTLDEDDFRKIRHYYGFGVPAVVGEGFCTLRGKPMTREERLASTFQGALTGIYDDFFDKTHLGKDAIRNMMEDPFAYEPASSLEKLFITLLRKVYDKLPDRDYFRQSFDRVFEIQLETRRQASGIPDNKELREITFRKGGLSLLFYRSAFHGKPVGGEEEALMQMGGLMQLGNDIFDVFDDSREGISTLVTACSRIHELREIFLGQLSLTAGSIQSIDYPVRNRRFFLEKFILGISRCQVCLDQLEKLEKKTGGHFRPMEYGRPELICDMEKPRNILRSLSYYLSHPY
jgi:hypothetical protein